MVVSTNRASPSTTPRRGQGAGPVPRTQVVWIALTVSMTAVGGLLWALQPSATDAATMLAAVQVDGAVATAAAQNTRSLLAAEAAVDPDRWRAVVVHHSGSRFGTASSISAEHVRNELSGLGYHFLIGNGRGLGDGEVHVGYRWKDQLAGAHVAGEKGRWYNHRAVAICLVGDGDASEFTPAQLARLEELISAVRGEFRIPASEVHLHRDLASTSSPGRYFPEASFRAGLTAEPVQASAPDPSR